MSGLAGHSRPWMLHASVDAACVCGARQGKQDLAFVTPPPAPWPAFNNPHLPRTHSPFVLLSLPHASFSDSHRRSFILLHHRSFSFGSGRSSRSLSRHPLPFGASYITLIFDLRLSAIFLSSENRD